MARFVRACLVVLVVSAAAVDAFAQAPVAYRLSFPQREHRLMDVEVTLADLPPGPLELRMSRASPGRYAVHEFAKNVFDVRITDATGRPLAVSRPNPHEWDVAMHPASVRVAYRVYGDRTDGTYLGIDSTHAHINMPAALMWARGLELRPVTIRFEPPAGVSWRVATQLFPGADPFSYSAPNLQYLIDSPTEFSAFALRTFTVQDGSRAPTFRFAAHHEGSEADLDLLVRDVERIVREARNVYGEYPAYENNTYTFIADYLPYVNGDGMEHRNSTIITNSGSIRSARTDLLDTVSHEFFHCWNVERIRPKSLEPFNLDDANMSGELWLAEGFTNYYGPLVQLRAGVTKLNEFTDEMGRAVNTVLTSPGRLVRSAEEMSQYAPFVDAATAIDRTNFDNLFISYYTWGSVIGLGLDLTLRDRSDGAVTLDHFMRALWQTHGKPGGTRPGYVDHPYTMADVKTALAAVSGDAAFAADFMTRYVQGHETVDYGRLLARAGLVLRPVAPRLASAGAVRFADIQGRPRLASPVPFGSPAFEAGLERDDELISVNGKAVSSGAEFTAAVESRKPGDMLPIVFERRGRRVTGTMKLIEDDRREIVTAEAAGQPLTDAQKRFRAAWLSSAARSTN